MNNISVHSLTREWEQRLTEKRWVHSMRVTSSKSLEEMTNKDLPWSRVSFTTEESAFCSRDVELFSSQPELERDLESPSVDASVDQILPSLPSPSSRRESKRSLESLTNNRTTDSARREETTSSHSSTSKKVMMSVDMLCTVPLLGETRHTTRLQESREWSPRSVSEDRRSSRRPRSTGPRPLLKLLPSTRSSSPNSWRKERPQELLRKPLPRKLPPRRLPRARPLKSEQAFLSFLDTPISSWLNKNLNMTQQTKNKCQILQDCGLNEMG